MPELPEVETTKRGIEPHVLNQKFNRVIVRQAKLRWPVPRNLNSKLQNQEILNISRRAKYLLIHTTNGCLIVHLGMSGRFCIVMKETKLGKHDHVDFELSNEKILRYTDPRRFGSILWTTNDPSQHKLLINLGVEPLEKGFSAKYIFAKAKGKTTAIKSFLMNAKIVVGIGNIYANEALFYAGINPLTPAKEISIGQYEKLIAIIKKILKKSIKLGGTTLKDFVGGDNKPGYFQQALAIYGRGKQPCKNCSTEIIEIRQNQRTTVYCPKCQAI